MTKTKNIFDKLKCKPLYEILIWLTLFIYIPLDMIFCINPALSLAYILLAVYISFCHSKGRGTIIIPIIFAILIFNLLSSSILLFKIICIILLLLSLISSLYGLSHKSIILITSFVCIVYTLIEIRLFFVFEVFFFSGIFNIIFQVFFFILLSLFCQNNRIPVLITKKEKKYSPEKELLKINKQLEMGTIAKEEYDVLREKIIKNL